MMRKIIVTETKNNPEKIIQSSYREDHNGRYKIIRREGEDNNKNK